MLSNLIVDLIYHDKIKFGKSNSLNFHYKVKGIKKNEVIKNTRVMTTIRDSLMKIMTLSQYSRKIF